MLFSRNKTRLGEGTSDRSVEAQTLARWKNAAEQYDPPQSRDLGEFSLGTEADESNVAWPQQQELLTLTKTITLIDDIPDIEISREPSRAETLRQETQTPEIKRTVREQLRTGPEVPSISEPELAPARAPHNAVPRSDLTRSIEDDLAARFGRNIKSALGPGTMIQGTFSFDSPVCVDGTLSGEVRSSSALIVGVQATIQASIRVGSLVVLGTVEGDIEADELIEIRAGGQITGDIITRRLVIEDGGLFQGCCNTID